MVARGELFSRSAIGSSRHQAPWLGLPTCIPLNRGEVKLYLETGSIVSQYKSGAVQIGYSSNQAETEAVAGTVAATFEAVKASENLFAFLDRDSRSAIGYHKNGAIDALRDCNSDLAVVAAMLDRVVDEVPAQRR